MTRKRDDAMYIVIQNEQENELQTIIECANSFSDFNMSSKEPFNEIFDTLMITFPDKLFQIVYILADKFDVTEDKIFRTLNEENRHKLKNFAMNTYHTKYYEDRERIKIQHKMIKKGKGGELREPIEDLFD